jgi:DNA modification methylase
MNEYSEEQKKRNTDIFDYSTGFTNELKEMRAKSGITDNYAPVKSIKLWAELIDMFGEKIIVDLFLGNGTTLIACEQLNRICYGMEIDPIYCDVIINRWEQYTGEKAIKL